MITSGEDASCRPSALTPVADGILDEAMIHLLAEATGLLAVES
jgi:hypothetical protein